MSFNFAILLTALLGYQAIITSATSNGTSNSRGSSMVLPDVILPNTTTAESTVTERITTAVGPVPTTTVHHESSTTVLQTTTIPARNDTQPTTSSAPSSTETTTVPTPSSTVTTTVTTNHSTETTTLPTEHSTENTDPPQDPHPSSPIHHDIPTTTPPTHNELSDEVTTPKFSPMTRFSKKPETHSTSAHTKGSHSSTGSDSVSANASSFEPYSWWKIVVTLVIFCAMAGIILCILKVAESKMCRRAKDKCADQQSEIEGSSDSLGDKISRV